MKVFLGLLQLCILFNAIRTAPPLRCATGWEQIGTQCFKLFSCDDCTVASASLSCEGRSSKLAKVLPEVQEQLQILQNPVRKHIFLGGKYDDTAEAWKWPDGTVLDTNDPHWDSGEPRHAGGDECMYLYPEANRWNSVACTSEFTSDEKAGYICEKSP